MEYAASHLAVAEPQPPSRWYVDYIALDAQLCVVELLAKRAETWQKNELEQRVAQVERVRAALHDLHRGIVDERTEARPGEGSPLVTFLLACHLWCCETIENLRRHATQPRESVIADRRRLAAQSSSYVHGRLGPLLRDVVASSNGVPAPEDHPLRALRASAVRAHEAIAEFTWV